VIVGLDRSGIVTARVTAASDSCGLSADRFVRNGAGTEIGHAGVTTTRGGTMSEANKELVRRHFEEIWNRKNLAVADELLAEHGPPARILWRCCSWAWCSRQAGAVLACCFVAR